MLDFLRSMLTDDVNGSVSSKRVIAFIAFLLCGTGFIANLFWGYKIDEPIFNAMMYIVIAGMGFTGFEKFAPKNTRR